MRRQRGEIHQIRVIGVDRGYLYGARQAGQKGPNHRAAAKLVQDLRRDCGGVQAWHDQDIRRSGQAAERINHAQIHIERDIGRHFAVVLEIGRFVVQDGHRIADLRRQRAGRIAVIRVGQERDPRFMTDRARFFGALTGDPGKLLSSWAFVDGGVRDKDGPAPRHHHRKAEDLGAAHRIDGEPNIVVGHQVVPRQPRYHRVDVAMYQHAGGEHVAVLMHQPLAVAIEIALALQARIEVFGVVPVAARQRRILNLDRIRARQAQPFYRRLDLLVPADQYRRAMSRLGKGDRRPDRGFLFALGETHPARICFKLLVDRLQHRHGRVEPGRQLASVARNLGHFLLRDAGIDGGLRDRRRNGRNQTRVERHRNDVVRPIAQAAPGIGGGDFVRDVFARQLGQRLGGGDFHFVVDRPCADVQRAAEDIRKTEHVVDLVRVIRPAGCEDRVLAHFAGFFRGDFRIGVGHGEDDGLVGHGSDHILGDRAGDRKPEERIGAFHRFFQRARLRVGGMRGFPLVHALFAALVDHAAGVAQQDVVVLHAERFQQFDAGDACRPGAVHHQFGVFDLAPGQVQRVDEPGGGDDGGAVLVVVKHRDIHDLAQLAFNQEAFRRLDVLQVDAAEGRAEMPHAIDEFVDVFCAQFQIDGVHVGKTLEQHRLAFHYRLGSQPAQIAQAQHRRAVRYDGDHVAFGGVIIRSRRIVGDFQTRRGDARRVG